MRSRLLAVVVLLTALALAAPAGAQTTPTVVTISTDATDTTIIAAPAAGERLHLRKLHVQNVGSATVNVKICDGTCATAANVKRYPKLAAGEMFWLEAEAAGSEVVLSAGRALILQVDIGATSNVRVSSTYYVAR